MANPSITQPYHLQYPLSADQVEGLDDMLGILFRDLSQLSSQTDLAGAIHQTEVDFGTLPVADATFTIPDTHVSLDSHIMAHTAWEAPTGKDLDELEMDDLVIRCQPGTGQVSLFIRSVDGSYLADTFKINYQVGL